MRHDYLLYNTSLQMEDLLEIFPEAISVLERDLADMRDAFPQIEAGFLEVMQLMTKASQKRFHEEPEKWTDFQKECRLGMIQAYFYTRPVGEFEGNIKKLERWLRSYDFKRKPATGEITDADIAAAKEIPIEKFAEGKMNAAGFICCPFHKEKTPSMKIYEGKRYFCFGGCGTGGDTIDFVMKLFNIDFIKAVKKILNK